LREDRRGDFTTGRDVSFAEKAVLIELSALDTDTGDEAPRKSEEPKDDLVADASAATDTRA